MTSIWKYRLPCEPGDGIKPVKVPGGAELLCMQLQDDIPTLWFRVTPDAPLMDRLFQVVATGQSMGDDKLRSYVGTWQEDGLVWHVFEIKGIR